MIHGVQFKDLVTHTDERGFFRELIRSTDGFFEGGGGQLSHSLVKQDVLKAWHMHRVQTQWNYVVIGLIKVALHDTRPDSPTYRETMEFLAGDGQAAQVYGFPPGVAHGYRCVKGPMHIIYVTSGVYDLADEIRIPLDDSGIGYHGFDPAEIHRGSCRQDSSMLANQKPNSENTLEPVSCPQCGSFRSIAVFKGEDRLHSFPGEFHVAECSECGLWFQNPRPRVEQLSGFYPSDYAPHAQPALQPVPIGDGTRSYLVRVLGYSHLNSPRPRSWRSWPIFDFVRVRRGWLHLIPRFIPDGQLFEMGCGSGSQLLLLQQLGWGNLHGVELAPDAAAAARARGLDVQCGMVENALPEWPDGYFDVVIASMVLEHCVNPFDVLRMIARKIKPNGELLFSTVNRDSWDARWYGTYWRNLDLPRHTVWFRKSDLMAALVLNFQDIDVCYDAQPIDFLGSARYRARERNALMDRAFERLGERGLRMISIMASAWGKSSRIFVRCKKSMHSSCP